jgi:hypothetical protein
MSELINITPEERSAIVRPASSVLQAARAFKVTNAAQYEDAAVLLKVVKGAQKELAEKKATLVGPINQALKAIRDLFRGPEDQLDEAEGLYKRTMVAWSAEQEELRRKEQLKLDAAARAERERKEEQARKAAADALAARQAGDLAKADRLDQKADRLEGAAAIVTAPIVQREAPRVAGIVERENWTAVVLDKVALVAAIANGQVPLMAFEPNMKFLNNQAKAMKKELAYPGVKAVRETILASGSK